MKNLFVLLLLLGCISCSKDQTTSPADWTDIDCSWFPNQDIESLKDFVNPILALNLPFTTSTDDYGQLSHIQEFVHQLNTSCNTYTFELDCYACVKTFPPLSEIKISFSDSTRIYLDIATHDDRGLELIKFHE